MPKTAKDKEKENAMGAEVTEAAKLIDQTVNIATIPKTLAEIQRLLADPEASLSDAATVIEKDPPIAAKVIRLANSPFYGTSEPITAIHIACMLLGSKVIGNLVVQATVVDNFTQAPKLQGFDPGWLWDHSFKTAVACRLLCQASPRHFGMQPNEAYTCGLLHDVGKMILLQNLPDNFAEALAASHENQIPLSRAIKQTFGFSDAAVCAVLTEHWRLGAALEGALSREHESEPEHEDWAKTEMVRLASTIAHEATNTGTGWIPDKIHPEVLAPLEISLTQIQSICAEVTTITSGS